MFLAEDFFDHPYGAKMNINIILFHNMMRFPNSNLDFWPGIGDLPTVIGWNHKNLSPKRRRTLSQEETISFRSIRLFLFRKTKLMELIRPSWHLG